MATENRSSARSLKRALVELPQRFEFYEAVRLLERALPHRAPVGGDSNPRDEVVRFRSRVALSFAIGDISHLEIPDAPASADDPELPADMIVDFFGAATAAMHGSLPVPYIVKVLEEQTDGRRGLREFLDLFNHRMTSMLYRAWKKSRLAMMHESPGQSMFEVALFSLIGMGTPHLRDRVGVDDRALLSRAGLLMRTPAPPAAIEALVRSYFGVPAEVEPFIPSWYPIEPDDRSRLGLGNASLGQDAVLGGEVMLLQAKFRVRIGPLTRDQYERMLPHGEAFPALWRAVRLAAGPDLDFDFRLVLAAAEVPRLRLETNSARPARLGGSTWLATRPLARDADHAILRPPPDLIRSDAGEPMRAAH